MSENLLFACRRIVPTLVPLTLATLAENSRGLTLPLLYSRDRIGIPFLEDLRKDRDFGRRNTLLTLLPNLIVELKTLFSHTHTTDRGSSAELVDLRSYQRDAPLSSCVVLGLSMRRGRRRKLFVLFSSYLSLEGIWAFTPLLSSKLQSLV